MRRVESAAELDREKRLAAQAAALLVEDGMAVGLGTGSTVAQLLPALAARGVDVRCVATSPETEERGRALGLRIEPFDRLDRLDIAIDGADQVAPSGWLVKGGGGAHTREKVVVAASERFVVIASHDKLVDEIGPPVPLELLRYGLSATLRELDHVVVRDAPPSPDGGVIADYVGPIGDLAELDAWLSSVPGVVGHGLFPPRLVDDAIVARGDGVERIRF